MWGRAFWRAGNRSRKCDGMLGSGYGFSMAGRVCEADDNHQTYDRKEVLKLCPMEFCDLKRDEADRHPLWRNTTKEKSSSTPAIPTLIPSARSLTFILCSRERSITARSSAALKKRRKKIQSARYERTVSNSSTPLLPPVQSCLNGGQRRKQKSISSLRWSFCKRKSALKISFRQSSIWMSAIPICTYALYL